ncbi:MAG: HEAT repeat domain-containing protein [Spirochaetaceae bacterium]|nr:HEAT repeat domain-containing protein [Spirochaetaceae bacterium]
MKIAKIMVVLCMIFLCTNVFAQQTVSRQTETTVEDEYLSSVEGVIIRELSQADDRDNKMVSLQYIEEALSGGRESPDIQAALDSLAGEGITSQSRTNGRLVNNFPDVRAKACELLAQMPTEESKTTLVKVALADNEPMVVAAAIRSLGEIGINENDEVVSAIIWAQKKYATLNPTSSLAFEILTAFEKLAGSVEDKAPMIQSISAIASNYTFATPVRTKAYDLLKTMTGMSTSSSASSNRNTEK